MPAFRRQVTQDENHNKVDRYTGIFGSRLELMDGKDRNIALAHFLRVRRERLQPEGAEAQRRRRRTPGLRREEVAEAAGISPEWYVKLEQGRAALPSVTTINALARALRLDAAEHTHLRHLARGEREEPFRRETVPAPLQRLVESMPQPAYVTNQRWDALAWNAAAAELLADFNLIAVEDRNILLLMCTDEDVRMVFGDEWNNDAHHMLAMFRTAYDLHVGDPAFETLVARLRASCPDFGGWWQDHAVHGHSLRQKTLNTRTGRRRYTSMTFQVCENPALRLTVFIPSE